MMLPGAEDELLKLLDALAFWAEPIFALNERHRIIFWNKEMERLLGWTYDEVAGKACCSVIAGNDFFGNRYCWEGCPIVAMAQRSEPVRQFGLTIRTPDDENVSVDVSTMTFLLKASKSIVLVHRLQRARDVEAAAPPVVSGSYADARLRELTSREIEVLVMLASGKNTSDVATHLGISPLTARNHIQHVFEKLEVHSKAEAVALAFKMRVVSS